MVINYRLVATFTHQHHIMQTGRYIFFVAVAFTLKITLTDRAHILHQTLIRVLCPLRVHAPSLQHPKRTISFPRGNSILARGRSSVRLDKYINMLSNTVHSYLFIVINTILFQVTDACMKHGGFYLGSIGGPAAILAKNCIKKVEVLEYPELGGSAHHHHYYHLWFKCFLPQQIPYRRVFAPHISYQPIYTATNA